MKGYRFPFDGLCASIINRSNEIIIDAQKSHQYAPIHLRHTPHGLLDFVQAGQEHQHVSHIPAVRIVVQFVEGRQQEREHVPHLVYFRLVYVELMNLFDNRDLIHVEYLFGELALFGDVDDGGEAVPVQVAVEGEVAGEVFGLYGRRH